MLFSVESFRSEDKIDLCEFSHSCKTTLHFRVGLFVLIRNSRCVSIRRENSIAMEKATFRTDIVYTASLRNVIVTVKTRADDTRCTLARKSSAHYVRNARVESREIIGSHLLARLFANQSRGTYPGPHTRARARAWWHSLLTCAHVLYRHSSSSCSFFARDSGVALPYASTEH